MSITVNRSAVHAACTPKPRSFWARLSAYVAINRQRRHLLDLDDHMLDDIGISRQDVQAESRRAPWNVPDHWRN